MSTSHERDGLLGEAWPGAHRGETRRTLVPMWQRALRSVRICGSGLRYTHADGMGSRRHRGDGRRAQERGAVFEDYDLPDLTTVNCLATIQGNYPSKGVGERGAWFKDSEGNLLGLGQPVR